MCTFFFEKVLVQFFYNITSYCFMCLLLVVASYLAYRHKSGIHFLTAIGKTVNKPFSQNIKLLFELSVNSSGSNWISALIKYIFNEVEAKSLWIIVEFFMKHMSFKVLLFGLTPHTITVKYCWAIIETYMMIIIIGVYILTHGAYKHVLVSLYKHYIQV